MPTPVHGYDQLPPKTELYDHRPPEAHLMDTVMHLQLEVDALKFVQSGPSTSAPPVQSKPSAFTSTKVPKFSVVTSWDQYPQVFDAARTGRGTNRTLRIAVPVGGISTRHEGEGPSIFAIALETLAVKAFGDMAPNVRLRLIYGTGLSPVTRTVPCGGISIAFRRRFQSGTLLTDVECWRAMQTRVPGEL